jgi:ubiquinone/menaquinone biosynthesis C-methylase UbiE
MHTDQESFKDHFSGVAAAYARHRPRYPDALFAYLASLVSEHECAWDCATGNGQAATMLAPHFKRVIATDASAGQIAHAEPASNVVYRAVTAEQSGLDVASVDLLTVAQAAHWFEFEKFYTEARRVVKPQGVLALWTYTVAEIEPSIDEALQEFYNAVAPYWPPERRWVDEKYKTIPFPFDEITPSRVFVMEAAWTCDDVLGYLNTWSSVKEFRKRHGTNPVDIAHRRLASLWPSAVAKSVRWPLFLRVGRVQ